jgi:hypothetical protein
MNPLIPAAIAAFIMLLGLLTICREKRGKTDKPKTQPNDQGYTSESHKEDGTGTQPHRPPTEANKITASEERKEFRECVQIYIQILALCGLAIYCFFTYGLWTESQKQTVNSARAWLGYQQVKDSNLPIAIDRVEVVPKLAVAARYTIENFGKGPAIKVVSAFRVETSNDPAMIKKIAAFICNASVHFSTGTMPISTGLYNPGPMGFTLFPKQTYSDSAGWNGDAVPDLKWLYVMGCVAYLDQFKSWHWTRYCLVIGDGKNPISDTSPRNLYTLYNDTDETGQEDENEERNAAGPRLTP